MAVAPEVRKVIRAARRVRDTEERLQQARDAFYTALEEAHAAGNSISALARALGVTRQRAQQLLRRRPV